MQTTFTPEQLKDPAIQQSNDILRACVHCGFCTATCPTYQVLGDELDSPRGRIYLIKDMLENERVPDEKTVKHIDRCLSCLACMSTCPSGVHYMHLVDHAREYIERKYKRSFADRMIRSLLARILPHPGRFRWAMRAAKLGMPLKPVMPKRLAGMMDMVPLDLAPASADDRPQVFPAIGDRKRRVALMTGCAQKALDTDINEATIRILRRHGCEVVVAKGAGCCGALTHHMGKTLDSHAFAAANIKAWTKEIDGEGLDAVVINTSGCGTTIKDYGHMFRNTSMAGKAAQISNIAKDISEVLSGIELDCLEPKAFRVAYHAACSLQHGQQIKALPKDLLRKAGFTVLEPADAHLCCGSAGTYNLMQPEISAQLKTRKISSLDAVAPQIIAAGNIGCMVQIGSGTPTPVVHTVELLDWATGGPVPRKLHNFMLTQDN